MVLQRTVAPIIDGVLIPLSHREGPRDLRAHAQAAPSNALVIQAGAALSLCFQKQIPAPALRKFAGNPLELGDKSSGNPLEPGNKSTGNPWEPGDKSAGNPLEPRDKSAGSPLEPGDLTGILLSSTKLSRDPGGQHVRSQLLPQ